MKHAAFRLHSYTCVAKLLILRYHLLFLCPSNFVSFFLTSSNYVEFLFQPPVLGTTCLNAYIVYSRSRYRVEREKASDDCIAKWLRMGNVKEIVEVKENENSRGEGLKKEKEDDESFAGMD